MYINATLLPFWLDVCNKLKNANASMNLYNKEQGVRAEVKLPLELSF